MRNRKHFLIKRVRIWSVQVIASFFGCLFLMCSNAYADECVEVRDGAFALGVNEHCDFSTGQRAILVDRFEMGDGSLLTFAKAPLLVIQAKKAVIGNAAAIVGRGQDGDSREPNGTGGPTIVVIFEDVQNVRGLLVSSTGGDGVDGETGKKGEKGRNARCFEYGATDGEPGGQGGNGGNSGDGGRIYLVLPESASGYGISLLAAPGEVGKGGKGGPGGDGGTGKSNKDCAYITSRASGSPGPTGDPGEPGVSGEWGVFRTYTFNDAEAGERMVEKLKQIISVLKEGGYGEDAEALRAVLGITGLDSN